MIDGFSEVQDANICENAAEQRELLRGKRILCIADTPFQIIALLSIFQAKETRVYEKCDLLINEYFASANAVAACIEAEGIFSSVHCIHPNYGRTRLRAVRCFLSMAMRPRFNKRRFFLSYPFLKGQYYDILMCSSGKRITIEAFEYCVRDGFTIIYDDGIGTHDGDTLTEGIILDEVLRKDAIARLGKRAQTKERMKKTLRLLRFLARYHRIKALWLFSPGALEKQIYTGVRIMKIESLADKALIERAMGLQVQLDEYSGKRCVYLSLPDEEIREELLEIERMVVYILGELYGESLAIRLHPRRVYDRLQDYSSYLVDDSYPWELLLAAGAINEDMTLIAYESTAQVAPKMLFGLEPKLVFLKVAFEEKGVNGSELIQQVASLYEQHDRIFVPQNLDELIDWIADSISPKAH